MSQAPEGRGASSNPLSRELLLSLYLPAITISLGQGIAAPALPVYAKSFDVSFGIASLVIVLHGFGAVFATLPTGYLIDRLGRRPVLLGGPVLTAITSFLTAFASPTFEWLLVWRFLNGASSQAWELSRLTMIADTGGTRQRGRLMTWMMQVSSVSMLLAPSIGGFVGEFDIRMPFVLHGVLTILAILPSIRAKETDPTRAAGAQRSQLSEGATWKYVFSQLMHREMLAFLVAQFLANVARALQMGGGINLYIAYAFDASPGMIGVLNTASSAVSLPVGFMTGPIMDRWGRKKTIVPGFSLLFVAMLIVAATAAFQSPLPVFVPAYFFVNLSQAITGGNMQVLGADLAPELARGRFIGAWRLIGRGGGAVGPAIYGFVAQVVSYAAAFIALGVASLSVALIVGLLIRETVNREAGARIPAGPPS
jgi:MFS family permease